MNKNKIARAAAGWLKELESVEKEAGPLIEEVNENVAMTRFEKQMLTQLRELLSDPDEALREELAAYAHGAWAGWMHYMASKVTPGHMPACEKDGEPLVSGWLPIALTERWRRQMNTPYTDLPESEKESDREQADIIIAIFKKFPRKGPR